MGWKPNRLQTAVSFKQALSMYALKSIIKALPLIEAEGLEFLKIVTVFIMTALHPHEKGGLTHQGVAGCRVFCLSQI